MSYEDVGKRIKSVLRNVKADHGRTVLAILAFTAFQSQVNAQHFSLGTAQSFAVLGGSAVTNTGFSIIEGDLGVSPGSAVTGFPPGIVVPPGVMHIADAVALQAQNDVTTSYNVLAGFAPTMDLTGQDLGGLTLLPGVYFFSSSAQLTGTLTLNMLGNEDSLFVFQIGSTLTTASNSAVSIINGNDGCNVFWQVGSSATLGTTTDFLGNILALTSITLNTDANITDGRALARNGAVTLDDNNISMFDCPFVTGGAGEFGDVDEGGGGGNDVPEPGTVALLLGMGLPLTGLALRNRIRSK
jgi:type VI secretion system secreted protein VgrG